MAAWTRLVRYVARNGEVRLGQPMDSKLDVGEAFAEKKTIRVYRIEGDLYSGTVTDEEDVVKELLSPVSREQCSLIRCLGLNYKAHAVEAKMPLPPAPVLFIKPRLALAGPGEIPVAKAAQDDQLDFETELCCVIGKDARDVPEEDALDYALGFTASNDVSVRKLQLQTSQWCFGKGFDNCSPIGPCLVRTSSLNPDALAFKGTLSGEIMQQDNTSDMIFNTKKTISFLSQGTTLEKGSLILLGTPSGIGWTRSPRRTIQDGEEMRIWFDGGIGTLVNTFKYD